jgi:putative membrane protein
LAFNDLRAVFAAFAAVGWGLLGLALYRFLPILLHALGWRCLTPASRPGWTKLLAFRWIGESINTLLPVGQIGGDVVRARLLAKSGVTGASAGAGVAVDFLLGIASQAAFTLIGVVLLIGLAVGNGGLVAAFTGLAFLLAAALALWWGQSRGMFEKLAGFTAKLSGGTWEGLSLKAERLDAEIKSLLAKPNRLFLAFAWRGLGWASHVGEAWLILYLMGAGSGWSQAFVLESLAWAVRSAAFIVPAAIGAQEGGIIAVALALGLPLEIGLALALVKRGRELLVCGPGLIAWAWAERRRG